MNGDTERSAGMFGEIRGGEVQLDVDPASFQPFAGLVQIGQIETPWNERSECPRNGSQTDAVCTIIVDELYRQGLTGLEAFSHVHALYWMDRSRRDLIIQSPRHASGPKGCFALRSPVRPNPVALSVCQLLSCDRETGRLEVIGLDCLNGTPLIDVKPYFASTDARPDATKRETAAQ